MTLKAVAITSGGGGGGVSGSGTPGKLPLFTGATSVGDSAITQAAGAIVSLTLTNGGAGATNGTYSNVALTGGAGTGATADIVVAGGIVTTLALRSPGTGYAAGNTLSTAAVGGAGFVFTVASVTASENVTGNATASRVGAGTSTPRAGLDSVGGAMFDGLSLNAFANARAANLATNYIGAQFGTPTAVVTPPTNLSTSGLFQNYLFDLTNFTTAFVRGVNSNPIVVASTAGSTYSVSGITSTVYRGDAGDLATAPNYTAVSANAGVAGASLVSASTSAVTGLGVTLINGIAGHTIATFSGTDITPTFTGATTTFYGYRLRAGSGTGAVGTYYGLRLEAPAGTITTRWGISQEDTLATNQFSAATNTFSGVVRATGTTAGAPAVSTPGDTDTGMYFPAANQLRFATGGTQAMNLDASQNLQFNSGFGSVATAYGTRAWVCFTGSTGATQTIRASGNVSSVARTNVGQYTINFSTAMPDANYAASYMTQWTGGPYLMGYATGGYLAGSLGVIVGLPAGTPVDSIGTITVTITR